MANVCQKPTAGSPAKCRLGRQVSPVAYGHYNDCNCNEAGHEDACSEAVDERKVKQTGKQRRHAERDQLKESFVRVKEAHKDTDAGKEMTKEVKKMYKELTKSKKASKGASKTAAKKDD